MPNQKKKKSVFQILIISDNKHIEFLGTYTNETNVNKKFLELKKKCEKVKFPVMHINRGRHIVEAKYELVIIKKREENESPVTYLRNKYGEYVEHETNNDNWIVYDKAPYYKEETFWVYGFHPLVQRKTFDFIFNEIVKPYASKKETMLDIFVYHNKLLMEMTDGMELITCKNCSDAIRLYNAIESEARAKKLKYIVFSGNFGLTKVGREEAIKKIRKLTNWSDLKIKRTNTRP